jgi:hypothetical protein
VSPKKKEKKKEGISQIGFNSFEKNKNNNN